MVPLEDRSLAPSRLADLLGRLDPAAQPVLAAALRGGEGHDVLAGIAAGSPFLWGLCLADPARLERILAGKPGEGSKELRRFLRGQDRCRLVQDQKPGTQQKCAQNLDALTLCGRKLEDPGLPIDGEAVIACDIGDQAGKLVW